MRTHGSCAYLSGLLTLALSVPACDSAGDPGPGPDAQGPAGGKADDVSGSELLQMNDISFLFAVPSRVDELDLLPDLKGVDSPLIDRDLFGELMAHGAGAPNIDPDRLEILVGDYAAWRIVSARFDPCLVTDLNNIDGCAPAVRLVAQPMVEADSGASLVDDAALHLIYRVGSTMADAEPLARTLLQIKEQGPDTDGPLRVHPGLAEEAEQGAAGPVTQAVTGFIHATCSLRNLVSINLSATVGGTGPDDESTTFYSGFLRNASGGFAAIEPPALTPTAEHQSVTVSPGEEPIFSSVSRSPDHLNDFGTLFGMFESREEEEAQMESLLTRAHTIDNPRRHTLASTDCISCHLTTNVAPAAEARLGSALPDEADVRWEAQAGDLSHIGDAKNTTLSAFRNFGYSGFADAGSATNVPSISQRTINETDLALAQLRDLLQDES